MRFRLSNRIRFVCACVRAKLRVPVRRRCFRGWAAGAQKVLRVSRGRGRGRALPSVVWRWPANLCKSLLIDCKLFLVDSRCFSLLPGAFPLELADLRARSSTSWNASGEKISMCSREEGPVFILDPWSKSLRSFRARAHVFDETSTGSDAWANWRTRATPAQKGNRLAADIDKIGSARAHNNERNMNDKSDDGGSDSVDDAKTMNAVDNKSEINDKKDVVSVETDSKSVENALPTAQTSTV